MKSSLYPNIWIMINNRTMWRRGRGKISGGARRIVKRAIWTSSKSFVTISTIGSRIAISLRWTPRITRRRFIRQRRPKMQRQTRFIRWQKTSHFQQIITLASNSVTRFSTRPEKTRAGLLIIKALIRVPWWCIIDIVHTRTSRLLLQRNLPTTIKSEGSKDF